MFVTCVVDPTYFYEKTHSSQIQVVEIVFGPMARRIIVTKVLSVCNCGTIRFSNLGTVPPPLYRFSRVPMAMISWSGLWNITIES